MAINREVCDIMHDICIVTDNFFDVNYHDMEQLLDGIFSYGRTNGTIYATARLTDRYYNLKIMFHHERNNCYCSFRENDFKLNLQIQRFNNRNFAAEWCTRLLDYNEAIRRMDYNIEAMQDEHLRMAERTYRIQLQNAQDDHFVEEDFNDLVEEIDNIVDDQ